jgi:hypothetical protein
MIPAKARPSAPLPSLRSGGARSRPMPPSCGLAGGSASDRVPEAGSSYLWPLGSMVPPSSGVGLPAAVCSRGVAPMMWLKISRNQVQAWGSESIAPRMLGEESLISVAAVLAGSETSKLAATTRAATRRRSEKGNMADLSPGRRLATVAMAGAARRPIDIWCPGVGRKYPQSVNLVVRNGRNDGPALAPD